jgi:intracellular multiplication protein IcmV
MKNFLGRFIKIKEWSDLERTKDNTKYIESMLYYFLHPSALEERKSKNFDQVVKKLNLSDQDLSKKKTVFYYYVFAFLMATVLIWSYLIYLIFKDEYLICIPILCVSLVPLSLAFRFHFYARVIESRKLDYSVKDWMKKDKPM